MKVLFLKDLPPTARAGDVREIKNGFGRNYLFPNRIAVLATPRELVKADGLRREVQKRRLQEAADWQEVAEHLSESEEEIEIIVRAGPSGKLYGSVTPAMIASAVSGKCGREISRRSVILEAPIKMTGKHPVQVRLFEGVAVTVTVTVVSDISPEELAALTQSTEPANEQSEANENELSDDVDDSQTASDEKSDGNKPD